MPGQDPLVQRLGEQIIAGLLATSSDAVYLLDAEERIVALNAAALPQEGSGADHWMGRQWHTLFPEEVGQRRRRILDMARRNQEMLHYEDRIESGRVFEARLHPLVGESGAVEGMVVCLRDISHHRRQERDRVRLGTAIEQAVEAVLIMDENLVIQYVNQAFEALTGYSQQQAKGLPLDVLYHGAEQRRCYAAISTSLSQGDVWVGRTTNTGKNGCLFRVEKTVAPIRGQSGVILGYVSVWRDLGPVEELERQLRRAQKMEAIGTLASGIAHDFNNVLAPIALNAELLLERGGIASADRELLQEVGEATQRGSQLVQQILQLGRRREAQQPVVFALSAIVKECCKLLRPSLPVGIRVEYELAATMDTVLADPTQIHQALMNLCTNAAHAMDQGPGRLRVVLRDASPEEAWEVAQLPLGHRYIRLAVEDTGSGIPEEVLGHIFDPFYTTKRDGLGTGLGLPVVQNIITALRGAVVVDSTPGRGSLFALYLPLAGHDPHATGEEKTWPES
ncbi:MAG: PAS domain S-box protein [Thermodesulfobacteriota bacterium]